MRFELPFRLIFIRHGETDWNVAARLQGNQDIPMNPLGRLQAAEAGRRAGALLADRLDSLFYVASPLGRTRETMRLVRAAMGLPAEPYAIDPRLAEISFGIWQGKTWAEIETLFPEGATAHKADKWTRVPPQGESYAMLAARLRAWLETLDRETLAVSHGGVARALMALIGGVDIDVASSAAIAQGRVLLFEGGRCEWI